MICENGESLRFYIDCITFNRTVENIETLKPFKSYGQSIIETFFNTK